MAPSGVPLLPANGHADEYNDDDEIELEMSRFSTTNRHRSWISRCTPRRRPPWYILVAVPSLLFLAVFLLSPSRSHRTPPPPAAASPQGAIGPSNPAIDAFYARQSSTLSQASSRYTLRNNRPPPPGYDKWFAYARANKCIIDDYDQIARDFEPFYQLAADDPKYFRRMASKAVDKVKRDPKGMKAGRFTKGTFAYTEDSFSLYTNEWERTFARFQGFLPNMDVVLNWRDEPRVLFNYRRPDMRGKALNPGDEPPFNLSPGPTDSFYRDEMGCLVPDRQKGFAGLANNASAFLLYSSSQDFTVDLYPILSVTKIQPCFSDILIPSEFYYSDNHWTPRYGFPDNVPWAEKSPRLYWRGMNSGGRILHDNYHAFPRFRLIDIARTHADIMDVAFSGFHDDLCGEGCDGDAVTKEYDFGGGGAREDVYKYKYLFDTDGNSFSGRYLGLIRSGGLVFKSTVFAEFFDDWLRPFEHFIPVLPDLSDLVEKIEWAVAHDAEAQEIQRAGKAFAEHVLTDAQNDCYFSLVLLEWGRLWGQDGGWFV